MQSRSELERKAELVVVNRILIASAVIIVVLLIAVFAMVGVVNAQPVIEDPTCPSGERALKVFADGHTEPWICTSAEGVYDLDGERLPEPTIHERNCGAKIDDPDFVEKMIEHFDIEWREYHRPRWGTRHTDPPRFGYWFVPWIDALTTGFWCVAEHEDWNFGLGRWADR